MTQKPRAVLHIGGPKCGSSALQAALSATPELTTPDGVRFRYVSGRAILRRYRLYTGAAVSRNAHQSAYGYSCWSNLPKPADPVLRDRFWQAFDTALRPSWKDDAVPILSSEGWISHPDAFAQRLASLGHPRVTVVAFVRPPLEWLNAAYWQWGIWHGLPFDQWHARNRMEYRFGTELARWAEIPNVDLQIRASRQDVVAGFADVLGATAPPRVQSNASGTPSLIGFLLRNRARFRPTPHAAAAEFVVQRWCPRPPGARLWALNHKDVQMLRSETRAEVRKLLALLPKHGAEALLSDPRWLEETPYHPQILAGRTVLMRNDDLPGLHAAVCAGLERVCAALNRPMPDLPPPPSEGEEASIEAWDAAIVPVMDALLDHDTRWRGQRLAVALCKVVRRFVPRL